MSKNLENNKKKALGNELELDMQEFESQQLVEIPQHILDFHFIKIKDEIDVSLISINPRQGIKGAINLCMNNPCISEIILSYLEEEDFATPYNRIYNSTIDALHCIDINVLDLLAGNNNNDT